MEYLYGYSVAAELQPGCRYDEVVRPGRPRRARVDPGRAAAGAGAGVRERAAALVNILTDPEVVYPRKANLAAKQNRPHHAGSFQQPHQDGQEYVP